MLAGVPTGNATVRVSYLGLDPQTLTVTLVVGAPLVSDGGIVNGASFAANTPVGPGAILAMAGARRQGGERRGQGDTADEAHRDVTTSCPSLARRAACARRAAAAAWRIRRRAWWTASCPPCPTASSRASRFRHAPT